MDFDRTADELYGLRPEDFTAARNERAAEARSNGQRDVAKRIAQLRRPTVSAWVVNLLVRSAGDEVGEVLELGGQLREAQEKRRGDQLRALTERRRQLVSAVASKGQRLAGDAGHSVGESAMREVETTLEAAVADPEASEAVRAGRLTTALSYSGLGLVEGMISGGPERTQESQPAGRGSKGTEEERQALSDARAETQRLERDDERARADEDEARQRKDAAEQQVTRLEADLQRARVAAETAENELRDATQRSEDVARDLAAARQRVGEATARLDEPGG